jgi:integrase
MAVIRKPNPPKTRKYQAVVRMNGHTLSRTFALYEQAKNWSRDCESAIEKASPTTPFHKTAWLGLAPKPIAPPDDTKPHAGWTVKRALEHYGKTLTIEKKGKVQELARQRMWQNQAMAKKALSALTVEDVQGVVNARLADDCAGDTVRRDTNCLRALYRDAAKVWGITGLPDPFKGLNLPRPAPHRERRLEDGHGANLGEEERLRAELAKWKRSPDIHIDLFDFSIETGFRLSEAHAIVVGNVRSFQGLMRVELPSSKNDDPRRVVLSAKAQEIVKRRMHGQKPDDKLFAISDSARKRAWAWAREEAGVQDLRWHDLRHEGISRMAGKNLHLGELMAQSGHRDAESVKRYMNARAKDIAKKLG